MPAVASPAKVLVTGANGYIAIWVVRTLLDRGFSVRGTMRSESKTGDLRKIFKEELASGKLELVVVPDITAPGAFDEVVKGIDAIEHTASPFHLHADDPNELIEPAVKGTVGILESASKHAGPQLKRIVVTSSCASVYNPGDTGVLNESNWNQGHIDEVRKEGKAATQDAKYRASKTLAEKAAWDYVAKHSSELTWDLVTLCPPFVFGPVLNEVSAPTELGTSMSLFYQAVYSKSPGDIPDLHDGWVDVRDLALGHVASIEVPKAGGQRFILGGGMFSWQDWRDAASVLNIPGLDVPKGTPGTGKDHQYEFVYDSTKALSVLGMVFRTLPTTTKDIIEQFKAFGW